MSGLLIIAGILGLILLGMIAIVFLVAFGAIAVELEDEDVL